MASIFARSCAVRSDVSVITGVSELDGLSTDVSDLVGRSGVSGLSGVCVTGLSADDAICDE